MKAAHAAERALVDAIAGPLIEELVKLSARVCAIEARHECETLARTLGIGDARPVRAMVEVEREESLDLIYPELS